MKLLIMLKKDKNIDEEFKEKWQKILGCLVGGLPKEEKDNKERKDNEIPETLGFTQGEGYGKLKELREEFITKKRSILKNMMII